MRHIAGSQGPEIAASHPKANCALPCRGLRSTTREPTQGAFASTKASGCSMDFRQETLPLMRIRAVRYAVLARVGTRSSLLSITFISLSILTSHNKEGTRANACHRAFIMGWQASKRTRLASLQPSIPSESSNRTPAAEKRTESVAPPASRDAGLPKDGNASDLTDAEWGLIEPYMPPAKVIGRPRTTDLREVVNTILYVLRAGSPWRMMPKDFPPRSTVQRYFYAWRDDATWQRINLYLLMAAREAEGREPARPPRRDRQPIGENHGNRRSQGL